jgi:hypothetical protein
MAITKLPPTFKDDTHLYCVICNVRLMLDNATAGMLDATKHQTFACVSHFSEAELLIVGWADFISTERTKYQEAGNAWLNT